MRALLLGFALVLSAGAAQAAGGSIVPSQAEICGPDGFVDKRKAVDYFATANNLRWSIADDIATKPGKGPFAGVPVWKRLAEPDLCDDLKTCADADTDAINGVQVELVNLLTAWGTSFENPAGVKEPADFVLRDDVRLKCLGPEPPGQPRPDFNYSFPLRVRGSADTLFYERDHPEFAGLDSASIDLSNDETKHVSTDKITAVVGWPIIPKRTGAPLFEIIPYVGFNRDFSRDRAKGPTLNTDTADAGIASAAYWAIRMRDGKWLGNWLSLRPDYLFDHSDHSAIESLNLLYAPIVNGRINDYRRLIQARTDLLSLEPVVEVHWDNGWYSQRGNGTSTTPHTDYSRLGLKYGLSVTSDNKNLPVTLTVTETDLAQLRGGAKTLRYLSSDLSWAFDPKKYFTLELVYTNGRREDTFAREQSLDVKLGAKY